MFATYLVNFARKGARATASDVMLLPQARSVLSRVIEPHQKWLKPLVLGLVVSSVVLEKTDASVLTTADFVKIDQIKPLFLNLMGDLVATSRRPDLSVGDAECVGSIIKEFIQISDELSSFEYLITIEKDMAEFGDNSPMRGILKFAVEKSNTILSNERKRLAQLSDQCGRFPVSPSKTQQAIQVIDATTGILSSIEMRL